MTSMGVVTAILAVAVLGSIAWGGTAFLRWITARARRAALQALEADIAARETSGQLTAGQIAGLRDDIRRRMTLETGQPFLAVKVPLHRAIVLATIALLAVIALSGAMYYVQLGEPSPSAPSASSQTDFAANGDAGHPGGGDVSGMIAQLETKLAASPDDASGWGMLGWSYFQTAKYEKAADAYSKAAKFDGNNAQYLSALGESLVRLTKGQVTPAAVDAFRRAVKIDPADPRARYFLAVLKDQNGDHNGAMHDWIELVRSAPAGAPWAREVRTFVEKIAQSRGLDLSSQLPGADSSTELAPTMGEPNAGQVAAAGQMTEADRHAMIDSMVDRLAQRLKEQPRDARGWIKLVRARMVQGRPAEAASAYREAMKVFSADPSTMAELTQGARQSQVPGVQ